MNPVFDLFDAWNAHKGKGYGKAKWRSHTIISIPCQKAIRSKLRQGYDVETLKAAINNYALILTSPDYKWTYAWTMLQFLTRHHPVRRKEEQLTRWLPGEFDPDDYIKPEVKVSRARKAEPVPEPLTLDEKQEIARNEGFIR